MGTLRLWKKAVCGLSAVALDAIKCVCESTDTSVHARFVALSFLTSKEFLDLRKKPLQQSFAIHILARYVTHMLLIAETKGGQHTACDTVVFKHVFCPCCTRTFPEQIVAGIYSKFTIVTEVLCGRRLCIALDKAVDFIAMPGGGTV